jgi:hypothetical protein
MAERRRKAPETKEQQAERVQRDADAIYYSVFEGHPDGQRILLDLQSKFYDRTSIVQRTDGSVDEHATLVREGERNVMIYIMQRLSRFQVGR